MFALIDDEVCYINNIYTKEYLLQITLSHYDIITFTIGSFVIKTWSIIEESLKKIRRQIQQFFNCIHKLFISCSIASN